MLTGVKGSPGSEEGAATPVKGSARQLGSDSGTNSNRSIPLPTFSPSQSQPIFQAPSTTYRHPGTFSPARLL